MMLTRVDEPLAYDFFHAGGTLGEAELLVELDSIVSLEVACWPDSRSK